MSGAWIAIGVLALVALAAGLLIAREGRRVWTLLASALVFALAGYAWQGSPDQPGAPTRSVSDVSPASEALIETRRRFYNVEGIMPSRFVVTADGFSRRGRHVDAAGLLRTRVGVGRLRRPSKHEMPSNSESRSHRGRHSCNGPAQVRQAYPHRWHAVDASKRCLQSQFGSTNPSGKAGYLCGRPMACG